MSSAFVKKTQVFVLFCSSYPVKKSDEGNKCPELTLKILFVGLG
jgi:hypothetical protein